MNRQYKMRITEMSPAFEGWSKPSSGRSRDSSWRCPGPWLQRTWPWQLLQPIAQSPACVHRPDVYKIPEIVLDFSMYAQKLAHAHAHCSLCHAGMPCVASWQSLLLRKNAHCSGFISLCMQRGKFKLWHPCSFTSVATGRSTLTHSHRVQRQLVPLLSTASCTIAAGMYVARLTLMRLCTSGSATLVRHRSSPAAPPISQTGHEAENVIPVAAVRVHTPTRTFASCASSNPSW